MSPTIIPEVLELSGFYNSDVNREDVERVAREQFQRHKRFGLTYAGGHGDTEGAIINRYWELVKNKKDIVYAERDFVNKLLKSDLSEPVSRGFETAKSVFYKQKFKEPAVILVGGIPETDARVLDDMAFGINLSLLSDSSERSINKAKEYIEGFSAHEGNHIFLGQIPTYKKYNKEKQSLEKEAELVTEAKSIVFSEGLATFVQQPGNVNNDIHKEYMKNIGFWHDLLKKSLNAKEEERFDIIRIAANNEGFKRIRPGPSRKINEELDILPGRMLPKDKYGEMLYTIFVEGNGPAYHVGYDMWRTIDERLGMEKVKEVVSKGHDEFFKVYKSL
jgi:hypothetical protein